MMISTSKVRTYTRKEIVPFEEDITHEFKGHRTIAAENRKIVTKDWENGRVGECLNTRQQWSKYLCGMLNSGRGGVLYGGILDNGEVNGFMMSEYQKLHVKLQLLDVFRRFTPQVPEELWEVEFVPQIEPFDEKFVPDPLETDPYLWNLDHIMATTRRCWCDNDAAACHAHGMLLPWYIIEVTIKPQEGIVFKAEDGIPYIRKHGMTELLTNELQSETQCYRCDEMGHLARDCIRDKSCLKCGNAEHSTRNCPQTLCFYCNTIGHVSAECPEKSKNVCFRCNKKGHSARQCKIVSETMKEESGENSFCHWCEKIGHFITECQERAKELNL